MSVKQLTPSQEIENYLQQQIERREKAILNAFNYVGVSCLAEMRSNYDYEDQTGNLTSSKGYCIVVDGNVFKQADFEPVKGGQEGASEGEKFVNQLANKFPNGIVLIVVAGMNYAHYVAAKGYNVVDSAETLAERLVPQLMSKLGFKKR